MEDPESWSLLVASLAVCNLEEPQEAWSFLRREGLVRDEAGDSDDFAGFVQQEIERGSIAGPSTAMRVATRLRGAGMALPAGNVPDPWGKVARQRFRRMGHRWWPWNRWFSTV